MVHRKISLILLAAILCLSARYCAADLLGWSETLINVAAQTTSPLTGSTFTVTGKPSTFTARLVATNNAGTLPTLDCEIDQSPTGAANTWTAVVNFTRVTTGSNSIENVQVPGIISNIYGAVRGVCTIGGTSSPSFDIRIDLYHN